MMSSRHFKNHPYTIWSSYFISLALYGTSFPKCYIVQQTLALQSVSYTVKPVVNLLGLHYSWPLMYWQFVFMTYFDFVNFSVGTLLFCYYETVLIFDIYDLMRNPF